MSEVHKRDQFRTLLKCGRCGAAGHALWEENTDINADGPMGSLIRMSDNIATRTPQSSTDIGFINNTTEPVYKMLAVANAVPGSSTAETLIETYKDVIARFLGEEKPLRFIEAEKPGFFKRLFGSK